MGAVYRGGVVEVIEGGREGGSEGRGSARYFGYTMFLMKTKQTISRDMHRTPNQSIN